MFLTSAPGNKHNIDQHKVRNETEKWIWDVEEGQGHPRPSKPSNPFPEKLKNGVYMLTNWHRKQEDYLQGREKLSIKMFTHKAQIDQPWSQDW